MLVGGKAEAEEQSGDDDDDDDDDGGGVGALYAGTLQRSLFAPRFSGRGCSLVPV